MPHLDSARHASGDHRLFWRVACASAWRAAIQDQGAGDDGRSSFERIFRAHQNMMEWMPIFLPSLWLFAFWRRRQMGGPGRLRLGDRPDHVCRDLCAGRRQAQPRFRHQALASAVLVFGSLIAVVAGVDRGLTVGASVAGLPADDRPLARDAPMVAGGRRAAGNAMAGDDEGIGFLPTAAPTARRPAAGACARCRIGGRAAERDRQQRPRRAVRKSVPMRTSRSGRSARHSCGIEGAAARRARSRPRPPDELRLRPAPTMSPSAAARSPPSTQPRPAALRRDDGDRPPNGEGAKPSAGSGLAAAPVVAGRHGLVRDEQIVQAAGTDRPTS